MKVVCVIPARLASQRFPKKMLAPLDGKPLIYRTVEAAQKVSTFSEVVVATDHPDIAEAVAPLGVRALLTSPTCETGTDRLIELQERGLIEADIWVNWQGDEPFIPTAMIDELLQTSSNEEVIWTLRKQIENKEEIDAPNVVKVVCDQRGFALYFSRAAIPYFRDPLQEKVYYKHIGLYAFSDRALRQIAALLPAELEESEKLEQLRFLSAGLPIRVHETHFETLSIDTPEQLLNLYNV